MTLELAKIILKVCNDREKLGYDTLTDSDIMDIIDEAERKSIPCGREELIEAGLERNDAT